MKSHNIVIITFCLLAGTVLLATTYTRSQLAGQALESEWKSTIEDLCDNSSSAYIQSQRYNSYAAQAAREDDAASGNYPTSLPTILHNATPLYTTLHHPYESYWAWLVTKILIQSWDYCLRMRCIISPNLPLRVLYPPKNSFHVGKLSIHYPIPTIQYPLFPP